MSEKIQKLKDISYGYGKYVTKNSNDIKVRTSDE